MTFAASQRLFHKRLRCDYRRSHCEFVILVPWRPNRSSHTEEITVEVLDAQGLTRCTEHLFRVVPVDRPAVRLGPGRQGLAVHHPVGNVLRPVVLDSLGNCGWKLLAPAKSYAEDMRHRYRESVQGKHGVPLSRHAHALY